MKISAGGPLALHEDGRFGRLAMVRPEEGSPVRLELAEVAVHGVAIRLPASVGPNVQPAWGRTEPPFYS